MRARTARLPAELRPVIWEEGSDSTSLDEALASARAQWPRRRARPERAHAARLGGQRGAPRRRARLLPLPRPHHGAVGRPGRAGVLRRPLRWRRARPQRASPVPLQGDRTRAWSWPAPRSARSSWTTIASSRRGGSGPGQMFVRRRRAATACCTTPRSSASWPPDDPGRRGRDRPKPLRVARGRRAALDEQRCRCRRSSAPWATRTKTCASCCGRWAPRRRTPSGRWATTRRWRVLARMPRSTYAFFRQRFAQVTNPPIDPLRESLVMSLHTWLGPRAGPAAGRGPPAGRDRARLAGARRAAARRPSAPRRGCPWPSSNATMPAAESDLRQCPDRALRSTPWRQPRAARASWSCPTGRSARDRAPIPMLLALGAVHQRLLASRPAHRGRPGRRRRRRLGRAPPGDPDRLRRRRGLPVAGAAHGARAGRRPARSCVRGTADRRRFERWRRRTDGASGQWRHPHQPAHGYPGHALSGPDTAEHNYLKAANKGLLKIMSKMGISTIASYRGGQIFECLGLNASVVDAAASPARRARSAGSASRNCRPGARAPHGGLRERRRAGRKLPDFGLVRFRRDGERHAWEPGHGPRAPQDDRCERRRRRPQRLGRVPPSDRLDRAARLAARPARDRCRRPGRCRWRRSSRRARSSSASCVRRCRSAR